jgi:membrane-associated PAP2 superfamily phosphatase
MSPTRRDFWAAAIALALLLLWDMGSGDIWLARRYADSSGFALRDHWFTRGVLHEGGRALGWATLAALVLNLWWPWTPLLSRGQRGQWLLVTVTCLLAVPSIKQFSPTSCPWDLAEFNGVAQHLSHWLWKLRDGGPGRCFPSGHATVAFAFFSGYFALRDSHRRAAHAWLVTVFIIGSTFGWGQMARGAHFASHTLWTAWLCWVICTTLAPGRQAESQLRSADVR